MNERALVAKLWDMLESLLSSGYDSVQYAIR
jgi:hypothetical protein